MSDHDNGQIISDFCDAWGRGDLEHIADAFADDAVYHNIPMQPMHGKEAIVAGIGAFLDGNTIVFETHHQVVDGNLVMNERTDTITMPDRTIEIPVMGVFELADGKIAAWRDYFDLATFTGSS